MRCFLLVLFFSILGTALPSSKAAEITGTVIPEIRIFPHDELFEEQKHNSVSIALEAEFYHLFPNGAGFYLTPFARLDEADSERTHWDLRECYFLWPDDYYEVRAGITKVFWGVTEFVHLIDIINQTDLVESLDNEEKLGQPMLQLSFPRPSSTLHFFALPYFRERTFAGRKGRLRNEIVVNTDSPRYESVAEETHFDYAIRYSGFYQDLDYGISYFRGTNREPTLLPSVEALGAPTLIPFYEQIGQASVDLQYVAGNWLFKFESLWRTGQADEAFAAMTGGFEYTLYGILNTAADLGILVEGAYDDRGGKATTVAEHDFMLGLRYAANNLAGTEFLFGYMQDTESASRILRFEAGSRVGDNLKLEIEAWSFSNIAAEDLFYAIRNDDFIQIELVVYF